MAKIINILYLQFILLIKRKATNARVFKLQHFLKLILFLKIDVQKVYQKPLEKMPMRYYKVIFGFFFAFKIFFYFEP